MEKIERRRKLRTRFMDELYDMAGGQGIVPYDVNAVASRIGLDSAKPEDSEDIRATVNYLMGEGLIDLMAKGTSAAITHRGIREVEEARSQPEQPTEHLAPINIVYARDIINSQMQQGSPGAIQSLNVVGQEQIRALEPIVRGLRDQLGDLDLDEADRAELEAEIQTLESQVASPKPKKDIIESGLGSAKRILEGTAASAASSGLLQGIQAVLSSL